MDYFYLRNITEIKEEYTTFLINIMTPFIYEGIRSVYSFAMNAHKEFLEKGKYDADTKSPGILKLFQLSLKEIQTLNNHSIEIETNRIKTGCKCAEWFDDLVRAVIKSHIVLLTFSNTRRHPEILKEQFHNKVEIKDFIHKCYIESAKLIYNNPELFWHEFPPLEIKRNQREACNLIKQAIQEAIRKMLPYKIILREYLQNDYEDDEFGSKVSDSRYMNIQAMVNRDLHGGMDYENDPLGRQKIPVENALNGEDDDNYYSDGGSDEEDVSEDSGTQTAESASSTSESSEDYMKAGEESSSEKNIKQDEFLESVKEKLHQVEERKQYNTSNIIEGSHPVHQQTNQPMYQQNHHPINLQEHSSKPPTPFKIPTPPIVNKPKPIKMQGGDIPKAEMDTEVKNLVEQSNNLINKKKASKINRREQQLFDEIEQHSKKEEPDRKTFFEQYMK